jgi:putative transposase
MSDPRFRRSAGGVTSLGLHVVWCPKYRRRLRGGRVAAWLNELLDEVAGKDEWQIVVREIMPDHVHIFVGVRPTDSPAEVARRFNGCSSPVLRSEFAWLGRHRVLRSRSYLATSVGYASDKTVRRYIDHRWDTAA